MEALQIGDEIHGLFHKKVKHLVSNGLLLMLVTNPTCIEKENHYLLLILTTI